MAAISNPLPSLLAALLLSLASLVTLQLPFITCSHQLPTSGGLCAPASDFASCNSTVSEAILIAGKPQPSPTEILTTILDKSLDRVNAVKTAASNIRRRTSESRRRSALGDCMHLMDLSRVHVTDSALAATKGAWIDAQTWMSAVLTYHSTCLDELDGPAKSAMGLVLNGGLRALVTTSLSVLKAISSSSHDDDILKPVADFPSWLPHHDNKFVERPLGDEFQADVVVASDGSGNYTTVQEAVNWAPIDSTYRYTIYVKGGVYQEQVQIDLRKSNLMIVGEGWHSTIITGHLDAQENGTLQSATLGSDAPGVILRDLSILNTAGPDAGQAVALRIGGDRSVVYRCRIDGYQDTLYTHSNRQFFRECFISGTIDFIFGNAAVVFQNCYIFARKRSNGGNTITAQGREDPNQNTGISIQKCNLVPADELKPFIHDVPTYLGRPWRMYARVMYMQSYLGPHIDPTGWLEWEAHPDTLYYGEYRNYGPGANIDQRVKWPGCHPAASRLDAEAFTVGELIQGETWLDNTTVPYGEWL